MVRGVALRVKARCKVPSKPKVDPKRIIELVKQGNTAAQVSARTGVSRGAIWRAIRNAAGPQQG